MSHQKKTPTTKTPKSPASGLRVLKGAPTDPVTLYLQGLAPSGRRSVRSLLQTAVGILGLDDELEQIPWQLLEYPHLMWVRSELSVQGKATNTINLTLSGLRGVMKACFNLQLITADQWLRIQSLSPVRGKQLPTGQSLSSAVVQKLYAVCQNERSLKGKRDLAIITLMLNTGLRRAETAQLQRSHYNSRNGEVWVESGKGQQQRKLYLSKAARQQIRPWLRHRGNEDGALFNPLSRSGIIHPRAMTPQAIYDVIKTRSTQAGHPCKPHDLRRTFVTRLLEAGIDFNTTRQLAGHANIQTTIRYDLRDERNQRRVLMKLLK